MPMLPVANIGFATAIITAVINTILGFLVINSNPKNPRNIFLFLFIVVFGVGAQIISVLGILNGNNLAFAKLIFIVGTIPYASSFPLFYLFARAYLRIKGEIYNLALIIVVLIPTYSSAFLAPSLLFNLLYDSRLGYFTMQFTPLMKFVFVTSVYLFLAGMYHFIRALSKETVPIERNRLWYLVIGPLFSFFGMIALYIPPVHVLPWDMIGITITSFFLTYAILKHHLLNITVVIKQSLIYSAISLATIVLFIIVGSILAVFGVRLATLMPTQLFIGAFLVSAVVQYFYLNQQKVLKLLQQEQAQNKQIRDTLVIAAHELRTPLTIIYNNLSLILSDKEKSVFTPEDKVGLSNSASSAKKLITIVNNYIHMSLLETGKLEARLQKINACEITQRVVTEAQKLIPANHKTKIVFTCHQSHFVKADPDKLWDVLTNLIDNGLKFTSSGTITIDHLITGKDLITKITDTGIGIPQDKQKLLFQKMKQLSEDVMIRKTGGVGLGLYISQKFIELMHGKLWLEKSEEGKGSTFSFSLPLA